MNDDVSDDGRLADVVGLLLVAIGVLCTFSTGAWFFATVGVVCGVACEVAAYREKKSLERRRDG